MTVLEEQLILNEISVPGFYKVIRAQDSKRGLDAIIAIHDVRLSRVALGGTRISNYASFEDALFDVTRLARGMTHKSAAMQSGWGGAKAVILLDPNKKKSEEMLSAFGEAVDRLNGEYICAEDMGCTPEDLAIVAKSTPYVVGLAHGSSSGNPAPFTAWGVFRGIQAVIHQVFGTDSVAGKTIAIQGLGSVGAQLAEILFWHKARLIITDIDQAKAQAIGKKWGATVVEPHQIMEQVCDVFSPCAFGGILHKATIEKLRCRAIAGAANNQLLTEEDAERLKDRNILYAPDFVVNGGGLINVSHETKKEGYNPSHALQEVDKIYDHLKLIFEIAQASDTSTQKAVMQLIEYRLQNGVGKRTDPVYLHHSRYEYELS